LAHNHASEEYIARQIIVTVRNSVAMPTSCLDAVSKMFTF